ncbi:MAG: hypothetical protein FWE91_03185 [Defluviitaleaceae bacterium]|nr:hypothetical protein [Defluviitaleaceae bacterium]MCL2836793.1 hypothetical protein [Defluviitaleaceae bacterium]
MDTEKAKNAVIIILIILNAVIFFLVREKENAYSLHSTQISAINTVLGQNRISLQTRLIMDFSPRKQLAMSEAGFDYGVLEGLLFEDGEELVRTRTFERERWVGESGRVVIDIESGVFSFSASRMLGDEGPRAVNERAARDFCEAFLEEFAYKSGTGLAFTFAGDQRYERDYIVQYMGMHDGMVIGSTIAQFSFDEYGLYEFMCRIAVPEGLTDIAHEIYSADEALFVLARELNERYPGMSFHISGMEMVYFFDESGGNSLAQPSYMFTIKDRTEDVSDITGDNSIRVFVDAYTNSVIRGSGLGFETF